MIKITERNCLAYCDGSIIGNPGGVGGWGVVLIPAISGEVVSRFGSEINTTNNRMELQAVIEALKSVDIRTRISIYSDSQYVIYTMLKNYKIKANKDLWEELELLARARQVDWNWLKGHAGNVYNERADRLARTAARERAIKVRYGIPA